MTTTAHQGPKPRQTRQRTIVRDGLAATDAFVSAQQLHADLRAAGETIGLATVYRTLQSLVEADEADTIRIPGGETLYRHCSAGHHHHLICRSCGSTVEIDGGPIEAWAAETARKHGFQLIDHEVEFYGLCSDC